MSGFSRNESRQSRRLAALLERSAQSIARMMIQEKNATNGAMNGSSEEIAEEREESARARTKSLDAP